MSTVYDNTHSSSSSRSSSSSSSSSTTTTTSSSSTTTTTTTYDSIDSNDNDSNSNNTHNGFIIGACPNESRPWSSLCVPALSGSGQVGARCRIYIYIYIYYVYTYMYVYAYIYIYIHVCLRTYQRSAARCGEIRGDAAQREATQHSAMQRRTNLSGSCSIGRVDLCAGVNVMLSRRTVRHRAMRGGVL